MPRQDMDQRPDLPGQDSSPDLSGQDMLADMSGGDADMSPRPDMSRPDLGTSSLTRIANAIIDPRQMTSPVTGMKTVATTADPCSVWDPKAGLWRVFFSFADFRAEEQGLTATGIFGATSPDAITFTQYEELIVEPLGEFDTVSIETCDIVLIEDDESPTGQRFLLYTGGNSSMVEEDTNYTLMLHTSTDGVNFEPLSVEDSPTGELGVILRIGDVLTGTSNEPGNFITDYTIVENQGTLHMWALCIQSYPEYDGGICYSTSQDGINWEYQGLATGLSRAFAIQPTVFHNPSTGLYEMYVVMDTPEEEARIHKTDFDSEMWLNFGLRVTGFYHATSADGLSWTYDPSPHLTEDLTLMWEDEGLATGPDATVHDGQVFFFYPSFSTTGGGELLPKFPNWLLNLAKRDLAE